MPVRTTWNENQRLAVAGVLHDDAVGRHAGAQVLDEVRMTHQVLDANAEIALAPQAEPLAPRAD